MKPIIKYISLLLFSGLILPFFNSSNTKKQAIEGSAFITAPHPAKTLWPHSFIYQAIADIYFPELTN